MYVVFSQNNAVESVLFFHFYVVSRNQTQVLRLTQQRLFTLKSSHQLQNALNSGTITCVGLESAFTIRIQSSSKDCYKDPEIWSTQGSENT